MPSSTVAVACRRCESRQRLSPRPVGCLHRCSSCGDRIVGPDEHRLLRQRTLALAMAGLVLYPLAIGLPIMTLSRFGHETSTSVLGGTGELWRGGHPLLAAVVFGCSVLLPAVKLASLAVLSLGTPRVGCRRRGALTRILEVSGRWGMLDVLLVAGLVAAVKLGELVRIEPGPGAIAFVACIGLTMLAGATCRDAERHAVAPMAEEPTETDVRASPAAPVSPVGRSGQALPGGSLQ